MIELGILILVAFFPTNLLDKAECVKLELKTFDEIFGEGWKDNDKSEDLKTPAPTNFGQNVHHQIDRQNTQIGQIKPNSTDQNAPLTESDRSDNAKNGEEQNERIKEITSNKNIAENEQKRKIVDKFHEMKDELKKKGEYSTKEWNQIEQKIAKHLKVSRAKIFEWKKEFGLNQFYGKEKRKNLVDKFDQMKAELKRAGLKNSYKNQIDETVAKELGFSFVTIYNWKSEFGQTEPNKYAHSEQKELLKRYYEIKDQKPEISNKGIAKMLKIGTNTLYRWKKLFKRQQFHSNSVDGQSVEENAAANVQEIENSNLGSF